MMRRYAPNTLYWLIVVQWLTGIWLLARIPGLGDRGPGGDAGAVPSVSVIIPARNEEGSLPNLLRSLAAQSHPASEVIVVDDHSEDGTASVAAAGGATLLSAPGLIQGWMGKPAACAAGAERAGGDVLVFLDADVTLGPTAMAALLGEHRRRGGLVSVQPFHRTERPYERLSAICNVVSMMGTLAFTGPPRRRATMAFGPCLITSRADYAAVGGHGGPTVRSELVEDIALARCYRAAGHAVTVLGGRGAVSFRMYPAGLRQLVDGWTRTLGTGAQVSSPLAIVGPFVWAWGALVASGDGLRAVTGGPHRVVDAVIYAAWAAQIAWMLRRVGRFGILTAVMFPIPLLAFVALFARSVIIVVTRRSLRWRGRMVKRH